MLLAIDCGNTNIVFAVFGAGGDVVREWRADTRADWTAEGLAAWLEPLLAEGGVVPDALDGAILATVVPATHDALVALCRDHFGCAPLVVGEPGVEMGLKVLLDKPGEIGADRLVNAVAAVAQYGAPLICVDFGTATTFDVIDANGDYAGGAIAPGINLSLKALEMAAAKLPHVEISPPPHVIGTDTDTAMRSGIFWGYVSLIEGMVKRIQDEFGAPMKIIATGGLSPLFSAATDVIETTDTALTLRGLYLIYQRNRT